MNSLFFKNNFTLSLKISPKEKYVHSGVFADMYLENIKDKDLVYSSEELHTLLEPLNLSVYFKKQLCRLARCQSFKTTECCM